MKIKLCQTLLKDKYCISVDDNKKIAEQPKASNIIATFSILKYATFNEINMVLLKAHFIVPLASICL